MMELFEEIFKKLVNLGIIDQDGNILFQYMRFEVPGSTAMMPFHVDWVWYDNIVCQHYGEQNGDMMADPVQYVKIEPEKKEAFAYTFRNDYVGYSDDAHITADTFNMAKVLDHSTFLNSWLQNVKDHGYQLVKTVKPCNTEADRRGRVK